MANSSPEIIEYFNKITTCIQEGNFEPHVVKCIIKKTNKLQELLHEDDNLTPVIKELGDAIGANRYATALRLLKNIPFSAEYINEIDGHDNSLLHIALFQGTYNMFNLALELLNYVHIDINSANDKGRTPLGILCDHNGVIVCDLVKELLRRNANVNMIDAYWTTPLTRACERGNYEIISLLLDHPNIDINYKMPNGSTALSLLCSYGEMKDEKQLTLIRKMLGREYINVSSAAPTALFCACRAGNEEIAIAILNNPSVDLRAEKMCVIDCAHDKQMKGVVIAMVKGKFFINDLMAISWLRKRGYKDMADDIERSGGGGGGAMNLPVMNGGNYNFERWMCAILMIVCWFMMFWKK